MTQIMLICTGFYLLIGDYPLNLRHQRSIFMLYLKFINRNTTSQFGFNVGAFWGHY